MTPPRMDGGKQRGRPAEEKLTVDAPGPLYGMEADAFADAVLEGAPPFMSRDESLTNQRLLDDLRRQIGLTC